MVETAIILPLRSATFWMRELWSTMAEMLRGGPAKAATAMRRRTLGRKRHPGAAAEPELDTAGGKRLLHLGVAAQVGDLDFETLLGEEALLDADIERQERPGTALRLPDTNAVIGVRHAANQRASDEQHLDDVHPVPTCSN